MQTKLFDYHLPKSLIAQQPAKPRDHSRLLVLDRASGRLSHRHFYDLVQILNPGDALVLNETKVYPARLIGHKISGGRVEVFLLQNKSNYRWEVLIGGRRLQVGDKIYFAKKLEAKIVSVGTDKLKTIVFNMPKAQLYKLVEQIGQTPLPPYIKTADRAKVRQDYQTVFAQVRGSVAAPTAGLHFTKALLAQLRRRGIKIYKITLHVGWGTFAPVETASVEQHRLHREWVSIDARTAAALNKLKKSGCRIIAVGTTTTRALEAMSTKNKLQAGKRWINIYIYPGYQFKFVDKLITNFHLPQSSLLFLVSALAGRKKILQAYHSAVQKKYRFYSFGDAMLIR